MSFLVFFLKVYLVAPRCKQACALSNNVLFFVWCKLQMCIFLLLFYCELKHLHNQHPYIYFIALWCRVIWWGTHFSCVNNTQQYSQNVELFFLISVDGALFLFCHNYDGAASTQYDFVRTWIQSVKCCIISCRNQTSDIPRNCIDFLDCLH